MTREERLASAPLNRLMLSMAIPTMAAQIINILYNMVDRIYIGHIPGVGADALTGVGVTLPIIMLITAFSNFVGSGGGPLASIALGKGERKRAEQILGTGAFLLLVSSAVLIAVFYAFRRPILYAFGASDATYSYASTYLCWYLPGTLSVLLTMGLNPYIIYQGQNTIGMLSVLIGAVLNLLLDPILIYGLHMGVQGAALATVISQTASAVWVVSFLVGKKATLKLIPGNIRPVGEFAWGIFKLGVSPFIMTATESLITIVMNRGLQTYGGDLYVGSLTIMHSVSQLMNVPMNGFAIGVQPIISYNYGARNFARVRAAYRRLIGFCAAFCLLGNLSAVLFPGVYARLFTQDTGLIGLVMEKMPVFLFGMLIFGLQIGAQMTFLALGQAKISLFIAMLRKVILLVPLALILPRFWGVDGVYLAEPISDALSASTAALLFLINIRKILSREALDKVG